MIAFFLLRFCISSELILYQDPDYSLRNIINKSNMCRADEVNENILLDVVIEFGFLVVLVIFAEVIGRILSRYEVGFNIFNLLLCVRFIGKIGHKLLKVMGKVK